MLGGGPFKENSPRFFILLTIFCDVAEDITIYREENFGPVVVILAFDTDAEAVEKAND